MKVRIGDYVKFKLTFGDPTYLIRHGRVTEKLDDPVSLWWFQSHEPLFRITDKDDYDELITEGEVVRIYKDRYKKPKRKVKI